MTKGSGSVSSNYGTESTGGFWKPGSSKRDVLIDDGSNNPTGFSETSSVPFNFRTGPLSLQRQSLPIAKHRRQILYAVEKYPVVVVVGETGSGKSTQIPQYLYENGWCDDGFSVVCTQPRRIAAQTLAQRVSDELGSTLGTPAGYTVRFDDTTTPTTSIRYVTDGMLLREATLSDPLLSRYSVIMIDEAHERNLNTDALLGVIKKIRRKRRALRVVVCSATIDAEEFLEFFVPTKVREKAAKRRLEMEVSTATSRNDTDRGGGNGSGSGGGSGGRKRRRRWGTLPTNEIYSQTATTTTHESMIQNPAVSTPTERIVEDGTIISVDGRQHPVDILYSSQPVSDYVDATVETALRLSPEDGDVLCFLPSGEEVDRAVALARERTASSSSSSSRNDSSVVVLPLYGSLPYREQSRVFRSKAAGERGKRRVVFTTNIAETSVTVPDVGTVVDCGFAKLPYFDSETGFDRLIVCPVSQASANQRAGRAGRIKPGKCYRLYTEASMTKDMMPNTPPEILRTNLSSFILTLKALGIHNILSFDLMSVPSVPALCQGLESLFALGAIDDQTRLTDLGDRMAEFPTEPRVSRMMLKSLSSGCADEILCVASCLQVRELFHRPRTQAQRADYDSATAEFTDPSGDHVTFVKLMQSHDYTPLTIDDCKERYVNYLALKRAGEVRSQLKRFLRRYRNAEGNDGSTHDINEDVKSLAVRKCVTSGFFSNTAKLNADGRYYSLRGKHVITVSQASALQKRCVSSEYIVFGETYDGSRGGIEVRSCSAIEGKWLRDLAPHYWA